MLLPLLPAPHPLHPHRQKPMKPSADKRSPPAQAAFRSFRFQFAQHSPTTRPSRRKDGRESTRLPHPWSHCHPPFQLLPFPQPSWLSRPQISKPCSQTRPERLFLNCRTISISTAPCTSREMCCPKHCASHCAPCQPLLRAFAREVPCDVSFAARLSLDIVERQSPLYHGVVWWS